MSDGRKYYCFCDANCRFETMNKEQILAAIAQAAEHGLVFDTEAAFITKVKEGNTGNSLTFWLGTEAQYNAIVTQGKKDANCFYILTDGGSPAELLQKTKELAARISALTAADVGAAPAGYGYGEAPVKLGSATDDDAVFLERLNEQWDKTTGKTRQIFFYMGGVAYIGTLWNAGNGYGTLTAVSYGSEYSPEFVRVIRNRRNGTWRDWEYENPPLTNNVEYRTTERFAGKAVYIKRINLEALPNKSTKRENVIPIGVNIVYFECLAFNTSESGNALCRQVTALTGVTDCFCNTTLGQIGIDTNEDMSSYTAVATVKYTKD